MTVQAVFFDMGGTIETYTHTWELRLKATPELYARLLAAGIDLHLSTEDFCALVCAGLGRYHQWSLESLTELPAAQVWSEYILAGYPVDGPRLAAVAEDLMLYVETSYYHRAMRPEMPAVLAAIKAMGLKIGLISNVCSRGQVPVNLAAYGLKEYFDPIVLSSEYGRRKPDPAIFHYAAWRAGVPTRRCLYVGDRIARDIMGARRAGYGLAVQIRHNFGHGEADDGPAPDACIADMRELLDILRDSLARGAESASLTPQPVRAVLFDAGDILYYRPQRYQLLKAFLKELSLNGADFPEAEKRALSDLAFQGLISQDEYREKLLRLYGVTQPEHLARGKQILEAEDENLAFFPGIRETLLGLKEQGYLLGVVTDTASPLYVKLRWLERGGVGDLWDAVISSAELKVRKPDPRIYWAALEQLGLEARQAVFVGHKATELDGATAVGMQTVAFNYEPQARADFYIEKFTDLLSVPILAQAVGTNGI